MWAIIKGILSSRYTELYGVVFMAILVIAFYGSSGEGQASLFSSWVRGHIEDTGAILGSRELSSSQLADINSIYSGIGGESTGGSPTPSTDASTVMESAVIAMSPPDDGYLEIMSGKRAGVVEYTVQEGDLLSFIASDYGVTQASIIWANGLKNADSLSPGQVLRIPPITGVVHKVVKGDTALTLAKKYTADADRIIAYNRLPKDGNLAIGDEIIIPDGRIAQPVTVAGKVATPVSVANQFTHLPNLGDYFRTPTAGRNWGRIHGRNGVDIANSCGTPVYAAAAGIVTVADGTGYNGGFGKYIKITHPNGTETLYGHSSKLLAQVGQTVSKGQQIMLMGTTGRSTGCHLHFEVHGAKNPLVK